MSNEAKQTASGGVGTSSDSEAVSGSLAILGRNFGEFRAVHWRFWSSTLAILERYIVAIGKGCKWLIDSFQNNKKNIKLLLTLDLSNEA